ncbi:MAG TPA: PQQ-dependent sugar dehydrogenase [Bryobacteraceae bacterium]|nr:PQQ-dependent sugar dehydrogenase [Bryobacteraceae bacterium]
MTRTPLLFLFAALLAFGQPAEKPFGMNERVPWTTSRLIGSPDPPSPFVLNRAFPQVKFKSPVFIAQDPLSERFYVAEYDGRIYSFQPGDPAGKKDLFLSLGRGISAFSFHPKYKENGYVYVFSHADNKLPSRVGQMSKIYRYTLAAGSNPPRLDPASQITIVEWPSGGHNGGEAIIGPDGYLYVSTGDGTSGSDVNNSGQNLTDLHAVMMRLDVEHPDPGRNYGIPKDNPFVNTPGARPEIWAYGYRNPWRFSFDPVTGQPWVGDVGQDIWEMIELSHKGANHGWSVREGSHPFHPNTAKGPTPFTDPVVEHHHTECRSITGGYVYLGAKFPELKGAYVYGDYEYGKMWAFQYDYKAKKVLWHKELLDSNVKIASLGMGRDGSFYAVDHGNGEIYQLERRPPGGPQPVFPTKLSETGLFQKVRGHQIASGVIPYSINAPFWSDGAHKERFVALPPTAKIRFEERADAAWAFDDGSVTVKSFSLDMEEGNPASRKYIETRVVVKQENHWVGYSYIWNEDQSDATLVASGGLDKTYNIKDAKGAVRKQQWHYPSRNECMFCHSRAAGFVLGLTTGQMNRSHDYGKVTDNQLRAFAHAGLFKNPPKKAPSALPAYPDPADAKVDINQRVKTYLQVNCAMCHVSDGGGNSLMELGYRTPMAKAKLIGEEPTHETLGLEGARLVAPGAPERSVLFKRITRRGEYQMPPTSTNVVDAAGARLMEEWIRQIPK